MFDNKEKFEFLLDTKNSLFKVSTISGIVYFLNF